MKISTIIACTAALLMAAPLATPAYGAPKKAKDKTEKKAKPDSDNPYDNAVDVFVAKKNNPYVSIRIPDIISTGNLLVAAAEGRYRNADQANNDIIVSVSKDGKRWSDPIVAAAAGENCYNNPCLVYNKATKTILLFFQCYPKGVSEQNKTARPGWADPKSLRNMVCFSKNGKRWTKPKDVTEFTKHDDVVLTCSGPNPGVVLTRGEHKGRICIPFNEGHFGNWVLAAAYSDDGGKTWKIGQKSAEGGGVNEVSVAETEDGGLIIVSRAWGGGQRKVAYSKDGGETWGPISSHSELPSPNCQNGLVRYSFADEAKFGNRGRLLFSSPTAMRPRSKGVIKMSYDDGQTWPVEKSVGDGPFGYSALTTMKNGSIGLLFEVDSSPLKIIRFVPITLDWLTDGADNGKPSAPGDKEGDED